MTVLPIAVVGDTTTGGGHILQGQPWFLIDGRPAAYVGAQVLCGTCGPTVIADGSAHAFVGGKPFARHGDLLACGHRILTLPGRIMREISPDGGKAAPAEARNSSGTTTSADVPRAVPDRPDGDDATPSDPAMGYRLTVRWKSMSDTSHGGIAYIACADGCSPQHNCADDAAESTLHSDGPLLVTLAYRPPPVEIS